MVDLVNGTIENLSLLSGLILGVEPSPAGLHKEVGPFIKPKAAFAVCSSKVTQVKAVAKANIEAIEGNLPRPLATSIMQHGMKVSSRGRDRTTKAQAILPFTLMQDTSAQVQFAFTHICLR